MSETSIPEVMFELLQLVMKRLNNAKDEGVIHVGWATTLWKQWANSSKGNPTLQLRCSRLSIFTSPPRTTRHPASLAKDSSCSRNLKKDAVSHSGGQYTTTYILRLFRTDKSWKFQYKLYIPRQHKNKSTTLTKTPHHHCSHSLQEYLYTSAEQKKLLSSRCYDSVDIVTLNLKLKQLKRKQTPLLPHCGASSGRWSIF